MTEKLITHTGVCAPILLDNVDTDQIIPSREMKSVSNAGLGEGLFAGWRYTYEGSVKTGLNHDFVLNQPRYANTSILLGGKNFGCGSSREHAVWALRDFGVRVIIAESFGRIFRNNCARNNLLNVQIGGGEIDILHKESSVDPQVHRPGIDLQRRVVISPGGQEFPFEIDSLDRHMLLNGLDYVDHSLQFEAEIDQFIENDKKSRGWAYLS